ncbi:MAG: class I SAM-dependent methyltransferase [Bacteroidales bacterium]|nr:class I SAM-dependent methyltransferase [Bacteroidales bacterium]
MDKPTVDFYNQYSGKQAELYESADMSTMYKRIVSFLPDNGRVLEIGCGSGRDARALVELGFSVVATDASQGMILQAVERNKAENSNLRFICTSFPLADNHYLLRESFDLVLAVAVLMHFSPQERYLLLKQIAKMLKPQGVFYCTFKNQISIDERLYQIIDAAELSKECQQTGLKNLFQQADNDILGRETTWITSVFEKE